MAPSKPHAHILTTARANGTEVTATLSKDLLVAANGCAGHADPEPTPCSSHAISHGKRDVVCSRGMLPRLPPGSTARSARATPMLTGSALRAEKMFPVTRGLQVVSISVGPRLDLVIVALS